MAGFLGADPDELQRLGQTFTGAAQTLENIRKGINSLVFTAQWMGPEADQFRSDWNRRYAPSIDAAAGSLRSCTAYLSKKAQEQVTASAADAPALPPWLIGAMTPFQTALGVALLPLAALFGPGADPVLSADQKVVQDQLGQSPQEQAAWWNSLTPDQQKQFETLVPGSLLALSGLPADARAVANQNAANALKDSVPALQTDTTAGSVQVGLGKFLSVGGGMGWTETKNADGTWSVTLSPSLTGGAGIGTMNAGAGISLTGSDSPTYTFSSQAQAQAFESGLLNAAIPHPSLNPLSVTLGILGGPVTALLGSSVTNVAGYLQGYGGNLTSNQISGQLSEQANLTAPVQGIGQGGSVSIQAGATVSHDTVTGDTTATIGVSGNAYASLPPLQGAASGQGQAAVTWDSSGKLSSLVVTGSYNLDGSASPIPGASMSGNGALVQMTVDLTDPANQAAAVQYIEDVQNGNIGGAQAAYQQLYQNNEVVMQNLQVTNAHQGGVTLPVFSATGGSSDTTATGTWVKPPNGDFTKVNP